MGSLAFLATFLFMRSLVAPTPQQLGDLAAGVVSQAIGTIPPERQFPADSIVFDRSGQEIADVHVPGESRLPVPLEKMAPSLVQATIDTEDRNFRSEGAIDPARLVAAAWHDLRSGGSLQGASTITQQLAKVKYLDNAPTFTRKVRELFIAANLEKQMSKDEILTEYLNDIPYGHGAIGAEAAAHIYFNTSADKLTLAQAALLAGLPDAPSLLDPISNPQAAKDRQRIVLDGMARAGDITDEQADKAFAEQLKYGDGTADNVNTQPAFVARALQEVSAALKVDPATAGLTVRTTLDPNLQQLASQTVSGQVHDLRGYDVTDGALVAIDPASGQVVAYVGNAGPDVPGAQIDMAAVPRQPGSSFKLFTYSTAIQERKVTMLTPVMDAPFSLPRGDGPNGDLPWVVHNYDQRYHGLLPVAMALGNSLNIPAVKVELLTGIPDIVATARALGVTTLDQPPQNYSPSLTLGTYPVPLWEMAQAASVLASGGQLHPARFVTSIKDGAGRELLPPPAPARQVMDPGAVFIMNQILSDDLNRQIGFGLGSPLTLQGHLVSAKTGTTNDFKDNLTIGWTPKLVTATWVGNADDHAMRGTTGVTGAAPIWHAFMQQALAGKPDGWPEAPPNVHRTYYGGRQGFLLDGTAVSYLPQLTQGLLPFRPAPASSASSSASPSASASSSPSASASPSGAQLPQPGPPGHGNGHGKKG